MKAISFALALACFTSASTIALAQNAGDAGAPVASDAGPTTPGDAGTLDATTDAAAEIVPPFPAPPPTPQPPSGEPQWEPPPEPPPDNLVDPAMTRSWWEGGYRWFFSTTIDAGYLYLRPRASFGWGLPFTRWVGVDANPVVSGAGVGAYGGLRLAFERFDIRVGSRYFAAFSRAYLRPQESYGRLELEDASVRRARIVTHEIEMNAGIPVGPGDILALGSFSYVDNVPAGFYVFEETLRVVVTPPLVWRARGGYVLRFGRYDQHTLGLVADLMNIPKREGDTTVRAGPVLRFVLSRHFEVRGSFVVTLVSPDRLGLIGGDFTELGVRYRWATE